MVKDVLSIAGYQTRRLMRAPVVIVIGIIQPMLWLLLFGPLLQRMSGPGLSEKELFSAFAPGLLVLLALYGSLYAGFDLIPEIRSGVVERMRVTRARPSALILGKVLRDIFVVLVQAAVLLLVAALMGLRLSGVGLVLSLGLFGLTVTLTTTFSYAAALSLRDENILSQSLSFLSLPLLLSSGVLLPLSVAPGWLHTAAQANPFYHVVEATRSLMRGDLGATAIPVAFAVTFVLAFLTLRWSVAAMRRA
ncbi:ABC transporter permease [Actinomadura sp. DSM 109109]|nr:ABC transporter permease [Actinomadura lepetitiana]